MALGQELPDDLVADVLRRLPPRSLAVSRCASRAWRDLIDDRRLLRADLLPRTVGGIFINYRMYFSSEFLARPTTGPSISGDLQFIPGGVPGSEVTDHCNGLVLCTDFSGDHDYVANPATRQWAQLPLAPEPDCEMRKKSYVNQIKCLVYDPTVSPHYHVFLIHDKDQMMLMPNVPSHLLQVNVYSSETGRWEERCFAPEGHVVETTTAVYDDNPKVYWQGRLYILCKNGFILRISISTAIYTLIPIPEHGVFSLGRSEKGVYCALLYHWHWLQIFLLNESCGQTVWELKHSADFRTFACKLHAREGYSRHDSDGLNVGPWMLEDINNYKDVDMHKEVAEDKFEWNSDDDDVLNTEDMVEGRYDRYTSLLGFHPYKEVVFLNNAALCRAVAYHWNTSKFQDLGNICPTDYRGLTGFVASIVTSFIYTPCWMEDLPKSCLESPTIEDKQNMCTSAPGGSNIIE